MRGFNYKKATQALNLFAIKQGGRINKMKAIKLIWLADRLHLRNHGRTITGDIYFALKNGPVPSTTRDILELNSFSLDDDELAYSKSYLVIEEQYHYSSRANIEVNEFSQTDLSCLEEVWNAYGKFDQYQLRDISHEFPEWKRYESALNSKIASRFEMKFIDFFNDASEEFDFINVEQELKDFSKEYFIENIAIEHYLK